MILDNLTRNPYVRFDVPWNTSRGHCSSCCFGRKSAFYVHLLSHNFDITDWIPRINSAIIQALCPMNDRKFWPWRMDCAITKPWRNLAIAFWHQIAVLGMFVSDAACKNEPKFEPKWYKAGVGVDMRSSITLAWAELVLWLRGESKFDQQFGKGLNFVVQSATAIN